MKRYICDICKHESTVPTEDPPAGWDVLQVNRSYKHGKFFDVCVTCLTRLGMPDTYQTTNETLLEVLHEIVRNVVDEANRESS